MTRPEEGRLYKSVVRSLLHSCIICRTSDLVVYQHSSLFQFLIDLCILSAMPVKTGVTCTFPKRICRLYSGPCRGRLLSSYETILGLHNETKGLPLNRIAFYTLVQALHLVSFAGSRETKRPCLLGLFSIAKLVGRTKIHPELFQDTCIP